MKRKLLASVCAAFLLAACAGNKPEAYTQSTVPYYVPADWIYVDASSYSTRFRIEAVSGENTPVNPLLNTVINNVKVTGTLRGHLVDYYYLDLKKGQVLTTDNTNKDVVILIDSKNDNPTYYPLMVKDYPNLSNIDGRVRVAVMLKDPKATPSCCVHYDFTIKVEDKSAENKNSQ
ncbi:hypothetical protein [Psittacicella gerlachiana]|uniref:Lipoprotein n=1 Tax=Psittacicella gerlachiana TaxID=2028574 RepID=A0A3A1Y9E2_9GAMM|nr:hypothetical protein [Psittacicella gerlachiana]RIY34923.1 hypothetical protein CKF59_04510 [Psittacicella gerlachiana]